MCASTDSTSRLTTDPAEGPERDSRRPPLWRGGGWALLLVSLAAAGAGAFPGLFLPSHVSRSLAAPPALSVLLAAQAAFVLVFAPLSLPPRAGRGVAAYLAATVGEYLLVIAACVPLYVTAGWLSNAAAGDVGRAVAYLTTVALAAWGLGALFRTGRGLAAGAVLFVSLLGVIGTAAGWYLLVEIADSPPGWRWLAELSPVLRAFRLAQPDAPWTPTWTWFAWPAVGLIAALIALVVRDA